MIRPTGWQIGPWDVLVTIAIFAALIAWFALTSTRARANRAKLRTRRRHDRALRSIR